MLYYKLPKISCLLVTANGRYETVKRSIQCYKNQIYPNKELVVVNEGDSEYQDFLYEETKDMSDVVRVFLNGKYTLGALRNVSIDICSGEIFVQWDDDDFNMPERLAVQYGYFCKHPKAQVCYLSDQLHYYFDLKSVYWENWSKFQSGNIKKYSLIPGTLMAKKEGFDFKYPSSGKHARAGEDTVLSNKLCEVDDRVVLLSGVGYIHVYSFHGMNVYGIDHHQNISSGRSEESSHMRDHRIEISRTLDHLNFADEIKVMGRNDLSFIYRRGHV